MNKLTTRFQLYLRDPVFLEILDLVKQNSKGKIWIIGGFVYKNLTSALNVNKDKVYNYDIDFIVEEKNDPIKEIPGWKIEINNYGSQNYVRDRNKMSFTDIHKAIRISSIQNPTIEKFIEETPLNIQSIAYDLEENKIIGEKGVEALLTKTIKINNKEQAEFYAKKKGKKIIDILEEKMNELGFGK